MAQLSEIQIKNKLKKYSIPVVKGCIFRKKEDAITFAKKLGFPVVLKGVSKDITHQTEAGAVFLNLRSEKDVSDAFEKITKNVKAYKKKAKLDGMLVQQQAHGYEFIVGGKVNPQFGPIVLFGSGGIFIEVMDDFSLRVCPIGKKDAEEMVGEVKFSKVFKGFRGEKPVKVADVIDAILKVGKIMCKEKITEMDINPLLVSHKGVVAVDVRMSR